MIIQVHPKTFHKIRPLFAAVLFDMFVTAVLKNELPGRVYVDSIHQPTTGFIMTPESCFACGTPQNKPFLQSLRRIFAETVMVGDVVNPQNSEFCIGFTSGDWDAALPQLMAGWRLMESGNTCHYRLQNLTYNWRKEVPENHNISRIDSTDLHTQAMTIWSEAFDMAQLNTSHDFNKFWKEGFGFVALQDGKVVSACMTDVVSGDRCEIGIVTAASHRRMGLAAVTTAATVEHALSNGLSEVNWQTGDDNWGSRKTAEKVGFTLNLLYPCRFYELLTV
ncbi:MAG: GNAT family N-acetyltransferase [Chloroflexi bacterium]|nr:GNAT family N-acetyltransferase [Chloroflexota bacterium]